MQPGKSTMFTTFMLSLFMRVTQLLVGTTTASLKIRPLGYGTSTMMKTSNPLEKTSAVSDDSFKMRIFSSTRKITSTAPNKAANKNTSILVSKRSQPSQEVGVPASTGRCRTRAKITLTISRGFLHRA
jgi:hypothetical protein